MKNKLQQLKELSQDLKLLYVEDETELRNIMSTYLEKFFPTLDTASNGQEGLDLYNKNEYDLIITDILMPKLNGIEMATQIKQINENQNIVVISAYSDTKDFIDSIKLGLDGYILKPVDFEQLNAMLFKLVEKIHKFKENQNYHNNLELMVEVKTKEIQALQELKVNYYKETILALVQMIEKRDTYTGGHSLRVAKYAKMIAVQFQLDDLTCENIYQAGILHDIGKIAIPDNVLLKPSKLDDLEYTIIKDHVQIGVDMLSKIPLFKELTTYIKAHHERYDGSGYPAGLKGDEISLESQILAIADAFDAMTTSRIYKARKTPSEALTELESLRNIHFREDVINMTIIALQDITIDNTISQLPESTIEKERFSYFYKDQTTQAYNSSYLDLLLIKNTYDIKYNYIYLICIHNLNSLNQKRGWKSGDLYLENVFNSLEEIYKDFLIFRVFSDDFAILSKNTLSIDKDLLSKFICQEEISLEIKEFNIKDKEIYSFHDLEFVR